MNEMCAPVEGENGVAVCSGEHWAEELSGVVMASSKRGRCSGWTVDRTPGGGSEGRGDWVVAASAVTSTAGSRGSCRFERARV